MITENLLDKRDFSWVDVQEPQEEDLERLSSEFELSYLLVQDCLKPEHLPKYEQTDEGHFLMMRNFDQDSSLESTTVQELTRKIALFITDNRLVTIHRVELPYLQKVAERCQKSDFPKSLNGLIHKVVLETIRTYEEPIDRLQDLHDQFEEDVLSKNSPLSTTQIYNFRRQLFVIKRILKQTNDSLYRMKDFWEESPSMLQDLRENIDQLYFRLDELSDNFEHLFELHISLNEQRANEVMKTLTVFSSVLLPLNFIASFYGMNFTFLPGLNSEEALWILCGLMLLVCFIAVFYFKRRGWFKIVKD